MNVQTMDGAVFFLAWRTALAVLRRWAAEDAVVSERVMVRALDSIYGCC